MWSYLLLMARLKTDPAVFRERVELLTANCRRRALSSNQTLYTHINNTETQRVTVATGS